MLYSTRLSCLNRFSHVSGFGCVAGAIENKAISDSNKVEFEIKAELGNKASSKMSSETPAQVLC